MKIGKINRTLIVFAVLAAMFGSGLAGPDVLNLDSGWSFRQAGASGWLPAEVPGCVHTDLLSNGKIQEPFFRLNERDQQWIDKTDWEYRTTFDLGADALLKDRIELVFQGLDTYADVYLNESLVLSADNMFREWRLEAKPLLRFWENLLRIQFHSPVSTDLPKLAALGYDLPAVNDQSEISGLGSKKISVFARKAPYHYGWDWGPRFVTSGIWRPVSLEAWDSVIIRNVHFILDSLTKDRALYTAVVEVEATREMESVVKIEMEGKGKRLASRTCVLKPGLNREIIDFAVEKPRLWWPNGLGESFLYDLKATVSGDGLEMDAQSARIGVRTLRLVQDKDARGKTFYFEVNGVPVFAKGANYIPNDNFLTRVTPEKYEHIVKSACEANMNMLRVWGGGIYENDLFYDLCDRYGILLWHDFMFACSLYPGDDAFLDNVRVEAAQNIRRLRNHPSIALWCGNNEIDTAWSHDTWGGWGWKEKFSAEIQGKLWDDYRDLFYRIIADAVSENDASRSYWPSSPLSDYDARASYSSTSGDIHYWGVWHGLERFEKFQDYIGRFMSEYGFQSFPSLQAVKKFAVPEDWNIESDVMRSHQRSGYGNRRIMEYMDLCHRKPKDFASTLYVSQVMQADAIQAAIEAHRRNKPYCMGTLFWQINDCWPVASWSSIDYYGEWKALQYFAKKAYAGVIVSPFVRQGNLEVTVVSDLLKSFNGVLSVDILDFSGKNLKNRSIAVSIPPNSSTLCFREKADGFMQGLDLKRVFLRASLSGPGVQSSHPFYFVPSKDLDLQRPAVDVKVTPVKEGFAVRLKTDRLAKNLFLSAEGMDGFFSDNYFDLLPGEEMRIVFRTRDRAADIGSMLKWTSLADSY